MDNFVIENGWQKNIYFKSYSVLFYTVHYTSSQFAVTYNTLQVAVNPTNDWYIWGY